MSCLFSVEVFNVFFFGAGGFTGYVVSHWDVAMTLLMLLLLYFLCMTSNEFSFPFEVFNVFFFGAGGFTRICCFALGCFNDFITIVVIILSVCDFQ